MKVDQTKQTRLVMRNFGIDLTFRDFVSRHMHVTQAHAVPRFLVVENKGGIVFKVIFPVLQTQQRGCGSNTRPGRIGNDGMGLSIDVCCQN